MVRSGNVYDFPNNLKPSGCFEYFRTLQQRSWMKIGIQLNSATHGHLHELMGGSYGFATQLKDTTYSTTPRASYDGKHQFQHITEAASKILWRLGYMICPSYGTKECPYQKNAKVETLDDMEYVNTRSSECKCTCTAEMYGPSMTKILYDTGMICYCLLFMLYNSHSCMVSLYDLGITKTLIYYDPAKDVEISSFLSHTPSGAIDYNTIKGYSKDESAKIYAEVRDYLCDMGKIGDMFQATSSNDITFWVLHPNMERVWHLSRINTDLGLISYNETWDDSANTCVGHRTTDATPFKGLFGEKGKAKSNVYTNLELYSLLDANYDKLPYVYDTFRYHHCEIVGKYIYSIVMYISIDILALL